MKLAMLRLLSFSVCFAVAAAAGTWSDTFSQGTLGDDWQGGRDYFLVVDGSLKGLSAHPIAPVPLRLLEVGKNWGDYSVQCRVNVIQPNLLVCTTGALILRNNGADGYVFALHVATGTIEVYRLSDQQMLFTKEAALELKRWYLLRAELQGPSMKFFVDGELVGTVNDDRSLSGRVGVAVRDVLDTRFDDFTVTGRDIPSNGLELTTGRGVTLSWPVSLSNYVLKESSQLSLSGVWQTVTNPPNTTDSLHTLTIEPGSGSRFYMLFPTNQ